MAEALANRHCKRRIFIDSVGLIAGNLDPFSVAAMDEDGLDISDHEPKPIAAVDVSVFDLVIALTPESRDHIEKVNNGNAFALEYWPTPDPSDSEGNRNQVIDSYRLVRDRLETMIADRFPF